MKRHGRTGMQVLAMALVLLVPACGGIEGTTVHWTPQARLLAAREIDDEDLFVIVECDACPVGREHGRDVVGGRPDGRPGGPRRPVEPGQLVSVGPALPVRQRPGR